MNGSWNILHHGIHVAESLGAESRGHIRHGHSSRQTNKCASEVHVRTMDQAYTCHDRNIVRWAESKEQQQPTLVTKCGHGFLIHANENNETTQWCNTCNHVIMIMMMDIPSLIAHTERTVRQCPACFHNTCKWSSMSNATHADDTYWKKMNTPRQSNRGTIPQFLLNVTTHSQSSMHMTWPEPDACA